MYDQEILEWMLIELKQNKLTVQLAPNRDNDGCIRVVASQNPEWYSDLCKSYPAKQTEKRKKHRRQNRRKIKLHDTKIKRKNIIKAIENLLLEKVNSKYSEDLIGIIEIIKEKYENGEY